MMMMIIIIIYLFGCRKSEENEIRDDIISTLNASQPLKNCYERVL